MLKYNEFRLRRVDTGESVAVVHNAREAMTVCRREGLRTSEVMVQGFGSSGYGSRPLSECVKED